MRISLFLCVPPKIYFTEVISMNEEQTYLCSECGATVTEEYLHEFDERMLCSSCLDNLTTICNCCGERIWRSDDEGDGSISLCSGCREYNYVTCEGCGCLIPNDEANYDDDYPYCNECYRKLQECAIKSYNYKPEPIFYGSGNLFYGVELEIDKGGERSDYAEAILNTANMHNEHLYAKHDGSINDGFELVSHPMTLDYHTNHMNWQDVMKMASDLGYRSHQTQTCGLHIHVSRSAFGKDYTTQEDAISRIVHFVEMHWNELLKFSRRTEENINRWASRYGISTTAKDTYKNAKEKHCGRYVAVNLENYATIEFRLFRGTLRYKTFLATLQLVDEICLLAIKLTDKELEGMSWSDFVSQINSDKSELIEYLKAKRLYVNEPTSDNIETEAE